MHGHFFNELVRALVNTAAPLDGAGELVDRGFQSGYAMSGQLRGPTDGSLELVQPAVTDPGVAIGLAYGTLAKEARRTSSEDIRSQPRPRRS